MRNLLLILFLNIILIGCGQKKEMAPILKTKLIKENVTEVLDNWHKAATEANYRDYFGKMDSISVFIGTDASENWTKKKFAAFCKPYFDKGKAWDFKTLERNIYTNKTGDFVWFDELLDTWMGTCRGSGVLEKVHNNWKIKHYVLSVTIPNDDIKPVINVKKKNDSLFLSKFKK